MSGTGVRLEIANCNDNDPLILKQKTYDLLRERGSVVFRVKCWRGYGGNLNVAGEEMKFVLRPDGRVNCTDSEDDELCTAKLTGKEVHSLGGLPEPNGVITIINS